MKFYKNLYTSKGIQSKQKRICWKLKHNVGQLNIYVILLGTGSEQLEIIHCDYLHQTYFKKKENSIVGIANGYQDALLIVQRITEEVVAKTSNGYIKEYLISQW